MAAQNNSYWAGDYQVSLAWVDLVSLFSTVEKAGVTIGEGCQTSLLASKNKGPPAAAAHKSVSKKDFVRAEGLVQNWIAEPASVGVVGMAGITAGMPHTSVFCVLNSVAYLFARDLLIIIREVPRPGSPHACCPLLLAPQAPQNASKLAHFSFVSYSMPRSTSGDVRLTNRLAVLNIKLLEPTIGASAIAKRLGLAESTVRYIIRRYGSESTAEGPPPTKLGAGRPLQRSKRWKRCLFYLFGWVSYPLSAYRHLKSICTSNPFWSLKQLATAMHQWELQTVLDHPGRYWMVPKKAHHCTIKRYNDLSPPQFPPDDVVVRYLNRMGLTNHRAAKVPMLTVRHMKTRRQYVKDMILYNWAQVRRWPMRTIPPILFPRFDLATKSGSVSGTTGQCEYGVAKVKGSGKGGPRGALSTPSP